MKNKTLHFLMAFFAIAIGLYPAAYFFVDMSKGFLGSKSLALLNNMVWYTSFYTHIVLGGVALLVGWAQFGKRWRTQHLEWHRRLGKVYIISALLSAVAGIYLGWYANGGAVAAVGFIGLGLVWFFTTYKAYTSIKAKQVVIHQKMMIYSYAACFAAVTLRLWLPLLIVTLGDFTKAYLIVAWLCWVPNLWVAHRLAKQVS
ncbi:DUF2306 domain-containing protein [Microscilla marina]|uniref:Membrane protein, putative n=1 Tax=Microscilla marina ATCC 23134 TaxID=313606 RepID=A1ZDJ0_MICM2|nr:DUF2306 domain-containing protein [Microscilla marina]EAY31729.1 membrane protein, putative [Microscilla marina ATCC 23134]